MRAFWLLLALIPGAPAIAFGRLVGGSVLLILGSIGWNLGLYAAFFLEEGDLGAFAGFAPFEAVGVKNLEVGGFVLGAATVLVSTIWTLRLTSKRRAARRRLTTDRAVTRAHEAILKDDRDAAASAVREGLRCDRHDIDLLFLDWHLAVEGRSPRRARRARRRLRRNDLDEKWTWEVDRTALAARANDSRPSAPPREGTPAIGARSRESATRGPQGEANPAEESDGASSQQPAKQ